MTTTSSDPLRSDEFSAGRGFGSDFIEKLANDIYAQLPGADIPTPDAIPVMSGSSPKNPLPIDHGAIQSLLSAVQFVYEPAQASTQADQPAYYFLQQADVKPDTYTSLPTVYDVQAVRADFPALHQEINGHPLVWLDNGATSQKPQAVIDALRHYYEADNSNIHRGAHTLATRSTDAYEDARTKIQHFIGARSSDEIIFVRGATEAINLVANAYGATFLKPGDEILISTLEHHSNIVPWQFVAKKTGAKIIPIPIDDHGDLILEKYEKLLGPRTRLVAVTHVSNALGTIVPVELISRMAHQAGALVLVDGAQAVPHFRVNVQAIDADFYVFSGHKVFGPTGIGVVYGKQDVLRAMSPWQGGGGMIEKVTMHESTFTDIPYKFEAGTGSIADAIGLGAAVDYLNKINFEAAAAYEHMLLNYATMALQEIPGLRIIGNSQHKAAVISFVMDGKRVADIGKYLDKFGIAVRAGHHCAQPALAHYDLEATVRASLALYNTKSDIDALVIALRNCK